MSLHNPFVRPEATTWSVDDILRRARDGQLYIPSFQRSFRWGADDVRKLFDSIYRGYPIGDLLLWETERTEGTTTTFGPVNFEPAGGRGFVIIDGQQRITSLVAVLLGNALDVPQDSRFQLLFNLKDPGFVYTPRGRENLTESFLPLREVSDTVRFLEWLQARKLPEEFVKSANYLVRSLRDYRVPVYVVHTPDEGQIREIFVRMNETGKRLQADEIFDALQRGQHGTGLRALAERLKGLGFGTLEEDWLLKATAAVLGIDVTRNLSEALRGFKPEEIQRGLKDTELAIQRVIRFLKSDVGVPHVELLPYRFPLVPLAKLFHLIPDTSEEAQHSLAAWVWRGAWTGQHARSDAPSIRAALEHITKNEKSTVLGLLATTPLPDKPFKLRRHDFRAAGTKLTCAVLASQKPRHLETGDQIDISWLIDQNGANSFQQVVRRGDEELHGTDNRLLHDKDIHGPMRDAIVHASTEVLDSHLISPAAQDGLRYGNDGRFLDLRREAIEMAVKEFLMAHTVIRDDK